MFGFLLGGLLLGGMALARSRGTSGRASTGRTAGWRGRSSSTRSSACAQTPTQAAALRNEGAVMTWVRCTGRTTREVSQLARALQESGTGGGLAERVMDEWNRIVAGQRCDLSVTQILASWNGDEAALEHWLGCSGRNGRDVGTLAEQLQHTGHAATAERVLDRWTAISSPTERA